MIFVKVYTGIDWLESTWENFISDLKMTIGKVVGDQVVCVFFPKLERADDKRFILIEIFTEESYDTRLALKQGVESKVRRFGVAVPLQVVVQECLRA